MIQLHLLGRQRVHRQRVVAMRWCVAVTKARAYVKRPIPPRPDAALQFLLVAPIRFNVPTADESLEGLVNT